MFSSAGMIAVVLHDLPLGGTERIAIRLANRWAAAGRNVILFCGSKQGPLAGMIDRGVEVVECDPPIPRGPGSRRRLGEATAEFIAALGPDILFVPGNFHWPVLAAVDRLPEHLRPGVVAQISTPLFRHGRGPLRQIAYNLRTRRQLRRVDRAISLSPAMTADADAVLGRRVTQCIRLPALDDPEPTPRAPASGAVVLAAGRMVREKGFDIALRAFARLEDQTTRLVIVGEGPRRAELLALAEELGVAGRTEFPGYVPDIRPWLTVARAFLVSSWYEGYAAVIVEALDAGRPVVSTDCTPAAVELLQRPCAGRVAPIGDDVALAECLRQVLAAPAPDPDSLAETVAGYRIGPISEAYLQVFDAIALRRSVSAAARVSAKPARRPWRAFGETVQPVWRRSG